MNAHFEAQRDALREQLRQQRALISERLGPPAAARFPRSLVLRLLVEHPEVAARLAVGLAALWRAR